MHPIELLAALTVADRTRDRYHEIEHHLAVRNQRRLARLERRRRRRPLRLPSLLDRGGGRASTLRARIDPA